MVKLQIKVWRILIVTISLVSCSSPKKETIDKFILYGYMGYCFKDSVNYRFDSTRLDIREYIEVKKDSAIKIARKIYNSPAEYYTMNSYLFYSMQEKFNNMLLKGKFKKLYVSSHKFYIYDGLSYSLYYKTSKQREVLINYNPRELPDSLRILHNYMENLIDCASNCSHSFEYCPIVKKDALSLFKRHRPPPIAKSIIFTPPEVKNTTE